MAGLKQAKQPKKTPTWVWLFWFFCMVLFVTVMFRYSWQKVKATEDRNAQLAKIAAIDEAAARNKQHEEKERAEKAEAEFRAAKDQAFMWCRNQHDIPVMGFGFKVVCVKAEAVSWEQKIEGDHP